MTQVHRIRLLLEDSYNVQAQADAPAAPNMLPFLGIPVKERLILLCLMDQSSMEEIKAALPWAKQTDTRMQSPMIVLAAARLRGLLDTPTFWINAGPEPACETGDLTDPETPFPILARDVPIDTERQLSNLFYPSASVMLFGHLVPPSLMELGLKARVTLYLLVVEQMEWEEIQSLVGCTEWHIKATIRQAIEVLETNDH